MADSTTTGLTAASTLAGTETFPVVQSGSKKATINQVKDYIAPLATPSWSNVTGKPTTFSPVVEEVQDILGAAVVAGANMTVTYDDTAGTLTLASTGGGGGSSPLTTKGDIYTYTTTDARLPVGTNGQVLVADSAEASGLKWAAAGAASAGGSDTQIQFNSSGSLSGDSGLTFNTTNKAVTLGGATVTADAPILNLSQTWNNGAVAFTGIKLNVTGTALSSSSKLLDLQLGGTTKMRVTATSGGGANLDVVDYVRCQRFMASNNTWSSFYGVMDSGGIALANTSFFSWVDSGTPDYSGNGVTRMYREANHHIGLRNAANPYTLSVYSTWTSSTNYGRLSFVASASNYRITAQKGSSGSILPILKDYFASTIDPTTSDVPDGTSVVWKNTTSGVVKLWANNGGTMVSVALA